MAVADNAESLLQRPSDNAFPILDRVPSSYNPLSTFILPKGEDRHYTQQFADMYFARLARVKPAVEQIAEEAWEGFEIAGETARRVDRVLDVRQGELCWVVGTVYMEMPLKPNILDDLSKEHWISAPPDREKYTSPGGKDETMLEDESGRLRLTGQHLQSQMLVTGCIIAAMGTENADGAFEVIDTRIADLPRQPERWERDDEALAIAGKAVKKQRPESGKVAIISGLEISGDTADNLYLDLLTEYLLGEVSSSPGTSDAAQISRLVIAGNSLAHASPIPTRDELATRKGGKKYGYDASTYNPTPTEHLDDFLAALLPSIPITLLPGTSDPANVALPQQPLHHALFPHSREYANRPTEEEASPSWFDSVTNPWEGDVDGWRFLGTGGQPIDDVYKYVAGEDRLDMMEHLLRWRCNAPTAPDTLWCYPFQMQDPLLIKDCPHVYFVGNQPRFETRVIDGPAGQLVRIIAVPKFRETGVLVLVDAETLGVECVQFGTFDRG
ncbi:DNA polymerase delta small subunit Cdc1 [Coniosporium apollinis]|uniref:DNA polymerase delta small subunit Cdc1 n=1 Tax=Coniosporium apollinis TaxID=61459 RepID=A0ABQ9NLH5_9PEZI|nr:DNA polymerase delta small subunit Cdc1 [Coniosporium apollinis]